MGRVERRQLTLEHLDDASPDLGGGGLENLVTVCEVNVEARLLEARGAGDAAGGGRSDAVAAQDRDGPVDEPAARELGALLSRQLRGQHSVHR